MRLKNVPGADAVIDACPYALREKDAVPGGWAEKFGRKAPLRLEIGMGKGQFITELALLHPEINYIGMEKYSSVLLRAAEKQNELNLPNLLLFSARAEQLSEFFLPGEVDLIYLNFSDPWPKKRHAGRRLTAPGFLALYKRVLSGEGRLEFKTDNTDLFDFSVESLEACGWTLSGVTRDLHADPVLSAGNVMTEYEAKFSSRGNKICKLTAYPPKTP